MTRPKAGYRDDDVWSATRGLIVQMTDRIDDIWGPRTPYGSGQTWPNRVNQFLADDLSEADVDAWVQSACILCSTGCGCDIAVKDGRMVGVRGRESDVVNHGRLGPKGLYGSWQPLHSSDRLTRPLIRDKGRLVESSWDEAMSRVVAASRRLLDEKGPESHGFYTSGQLFLEEYYALAIMAKAGLGTPQTWTATPDFAPNSRRLTQGVVWRRRPAGDL